MDSSIIHPIGLLYNIELLAKANTFHHARITVKVMYIYKQITYLL